jgi:hypothetical protein
VVDYKFIDYLVCSIHTDNADAYRLAGFFASRVEHFVVDFFV